MDEYTELLKEYIRPYDERIKKLEENEKEKNIEISLLKAAAEQMKGMIERLEQQIKNMNNTPSSELKAKYSTHSPGKVAKSQIKPKK